MIAISLVPPPAGISSGTVRSHRDCILATRAELELRFGLWSTEPVLCEDGRATLLMVLPEGDSLFLTRDGELLVARPAGVRGLWRAERFRGHRDLMWAAVQERHPDAVPGGPRLPRFWPRMDPPDPSSTQMWGVFDLRELTVVEWTGAERDAIQRAADYELHPPAASVLSL